MALSFFPQCLLSLPLAYAAVVPDIEATYVAAALHMHP
jgi:hypothetical protein